MSEVFFISEGVPDEITFELFELSPAELKEIEDAPQRKNNGKNWVRPS